ncbi:chromate transporter [Pedobacter psychroterrae]|uniref:chromate transporter n=1 Tax=Pedobacter psychroterrae TaxID=2530453 RepID=UPI001CEDD7C6|nr:chromate transporter [Pedobacter psychroterrae]
MAPIVRGADTDQHGLASQASGLWAIAAGMAHNIKDDQELLKAGMVIYDALYTVDQYGWLNEQEFVDAVAVVMITPGPVVITVAFIGYLVAGFPGACVAAFATFLPCYLFTVALAPSFKKIAKNASIKEFVNGITAVVVGALVGAVVIIASRAIVDIPTFIIAISAGLTLIYIKKIKEPQIILLAAVIGILIKNF